MLFNWHFVNVLIWERLWSFLFPLIVPRPPRSAVAGDYWIRVHPSVCPSVRLSINVFFFSIPRPNSKTTRHNRMKLSTMKKYILKLCTWVLVSSCDQNWGRTTWSKMRNFNRMKPILRYLTNMIHSLQAMKRPSNEIFGYVSLEARELGRATLNAVTRIGTAGDLVSFTDPICFSL